MSVDSLIRSQHFRNWQAAPSPMVNCPGLNAYSVRPLFDAQRFPVILNKHEWAFFAAVVCLFCSCGPSAVAGFIISVVINTVNRVVEARSLAHVISKSLKRIQPSIANRDSAFAVAVESSCKRAKASVFHSFPRAVCDPTVATVRNTAGARDIDCQASTRTFLLPYGFLSQTIGCCDSAVSAFAFAVPDNQVSEVSPCERNDGQPAVSLPGEVENSVIEFRTLKTFAMINLSHDQFLAQKGRLWLEPKRRYSAARLASLYSHSCEVCNVAC